MKKLSQILKQKASQSPIWHGVKASLVVEEANKILSQVLGKEAVKYAKVVYIKNNILTLACLSSIMAQEIKLNEKRIIGEINKNMGDNTVNKIRYLA